MAVNGSGQRARRSWRNWALLVGMAWFTLTQAMRLVQAVALWPWLMGIQLWPGPTYLAVTGFIWALAGAVGIVGLWRRRGWGLRLCETTLVAWSAWNWVDRLWVSSSPTGLWNWPFALAVNLIMLISVFLLTHAERKDDYGVKDE